MMACRIFKILPWIILLLTTGCSRRGKSVALPPVSEAPRVVYQEPSPETENQSTSTPVSVVDTLPKPAATSSDLKLNIPPPSRQPGPLPTKGISEPKRDTRPVAASEP